MLKGKVTFMPIHTCVEQSPVCLITHHVGQCQHKHCLMAYKKPQYFGISIAEFYDRHEFSEFTIHRSSYGPPHIIPKNPNPGAKDGFEGFRQSMNAISHLAGAWPGNLKVVSRVQVAFRWTEFINTYPVTNYNDGSVTYYDRTDVQEYAYYIGPIEGMEMADIDINRNYREAQDELVRSVKVKGDHYE